MAVAELTGEGIGQTPAELAARVRQMEGSRPDRARLDLLPVVADLVPGGMYAGATYAVTGSTSLAFALLAGPSSAGAWCGVVGVPAFGAEAAAAVGVDLSRIVLVPDPGDQWMHVTSTLADVLPLVLVAPPAAVHDAEASRLAARLRRRGTTLIALYDRPGQSWPRAEGRIEVTGRRWVGVDGGRGHLRAQQVTVTASGRAGRPHQVRLWLGGENHLEGMRPEQHARDEMAS